MTQTSNEWDAIVAVKIGPCRVCGGAAYNGGSFPRVTFHRVVSLEDGGALEPANVVPVCLACRDKLGKRDLLACLALLVHLEPDEWRYLVEHPNGGADYPRRAYGIDYGR